MTTASTVAPPRRLTLYVRTGCHLCEDMADGLAAVFGPDRLLVEQVDIDDDPELRRRFDVDVPVLADGEHEICRHFLDPLAVTEHLAGYTSGRPSIARDQRG